MNMNRIVVKSKVSSDGILHLSVPVGLEEADKEVQVTVEQLASKKQQTREEWREWVESMAGSWHGDFERPPQGEYEERLPFGLECVYWLAPAKSAETGRPHQERKSDGHCDLLGGGGGVDLWR
jgi:hypothetical protein